MWDQLHDGLCIDRIGRIIPTYVGSTCCPSLKYERRPNHSHVCGINDMGPSKRRLHLESFPRMWDQQLLLLLALVLLRIIPTYVGSTGRNHSQPLQDANHSHVCGINHTRLTSHTTSIESFPRMWDQRQKSNGKTYQGRIIPTYVGSTGCCSGIWWHCSNHSHVCGIN